MKAWLVVLQWRSNRIVTNTIVAPDPGNAAAITLWGAIRSMGAEVLDDELTGVVVNPIATEWLSGALREIEGDKPASVVHLAWPASPEGAA